MKRLRIVGLLGLSVISPAFSQTDFPGNPMVTPKKFVTRPIGGGVNTGATVEPAKPEETKVRYVTHLVLYENRMWTNTEGKPLEAKLIAFEDLVTEAPKGTAEPVMPTPPANPTVTRGGKIRLLVDKKPVEISLARLSQSDQEFVQQMQAALAKKSAAAH
ncbi:MAG: hypothetical protein ABI162_03500 [Luteolibacter sp.]